MIDRLFTILRDVRALAGKEFSGVGLIVSDKPERLPLFPIRPVSIPHFAEDTISAIATISRSSSEYHDGFHILSSSWHVIRISQYFSPAIVEQTVVDRTKNFGGRYLAALFGSALPDVSATGIASADFGVAVFKDGAEIRHARQP